MSERQFLALILAAGKGTRMKSTLPKVLHHIGGRSLLAHVLTLVCDAGADQCGVVIAPDLSEVGDEALRVNSGTLIFQQAKQLGTANAVLAAREAISEFDGDVIVLYGDTPLITNKTVSAMRQALNADADIVVLGFNAQDPSGYGRLLMGADDILLAIREDKDASAAEQKVTFCNSGVMGFKSQSMLTLLEAISNNNAAEEYYLTDAIEIARSQGLKATAITCPESEVLGVNSRAQLAEAEAIFQKRMRDGAMRNGATLIDPATVYFSSDTTIGRDVVIEPHVIFGPGVTIHDGARIKGFSHLEGANIASGATVGPYARLRPGADIGENAKVGNFVEIKNAVIGDSAKVNHLSYVGDAEVGTSANIGAGTITCNYDGFRKHQTAIGAGAFIGSNTALVAPVKIGDGAFVGSGSVITSDVEPDALAIARGIQEIRPGWAAKFRALMTRAKRKAS